MMIRTLTLLVPVTITPLLAVETVETVMIRGPLSQITGVMEGNASGTSLVQSDVVSGHSLLPASADAGDHAMSGLDLLHALRF